MSSIVVIADDLTGANATGVLLSRKGFQAATYLNLDEAAQEKKSFDAISISTNSRGMASQEAYETVANTVKYFSHNGVRLFSKRIDTTLRGNVGAEIDAVLDSLTGDEVAVVVASFPSSGRISVGGYLLVNGIPLEKTDVANDPKTPVHTSCIIDLVQSQTKYQVGYIPLKSVLAAEADLKKAILAEKEKGKRIIIIDATTDDEINAIASVLAKTELSVVAVDPGPFTAHLAKALLGREHAAVPGKKAFFAVGSVTQQTKRQLEELKLKYNPLIVKVDPEALLDDRSAALEIDRVVSALMEGIGRYQVLGITTNGGKVLNLRAVAGELKISEDEVAQRIAMGLGRITATMMKVSKGLIGGLYTSGGDVTVEVCRWLSSSGIEVKDEVLPLAAYGRIIDGEYNHTPIITKGGLVGDDMAMVEGIEYLLTKISNEYYYDL